MFFFQQGHRRVVKSGPAEEAIECRRHEREEREESPRGGLLSPSRYGVYGGLPRENI